MQQSCRRFTPAVLTLVIYVLVRIFDLDPFERLAGALALLEAHEVDELLLLGVFLAMFEYRRYSHRRIANVYRATAGAAQHVFGNFLQALQMVNVLARDARENAPAEILALCDRLSSEANSQLRALTSIRRADEKSIWQAVAVEAASATPAPEDAPASP